MRKTLDMTQKELSSFLGIGLRTWQNYEEGVHDPSLKVLEGLTRLGVDANWLLTGVGRIKIETRDNTKTPGIGERIKILRDKTDQKIFAHKFEIGQKNLDLYEKELMAPDVGFLASLCRDLRINPAWLLLGLEPKSGEIIYREDEYEVKAKLDVKTLRDVLITIEDSTLELIEEGFFYDEISILDLHKHAELIAYLYEDSIEHESQNMTLKHKTAKVKRLFAIAEALKGQKKA